MLNQSTLFGETLTHYRKTVKNLFAGHKDLLLLLGGVEAVNFYARHN